ALSRSSAEPETSARREGGRRSAAGAGHGRGRQRHPQCTGKTFLQFADVAAEGAGGDWGRGAGGGGVRLGRAGLSAVYAGACRRAARWATTFFVAQLSDRSRDPLVQFLVGYVLSGLRGL